MDGHRLSEAAADLAAWADGRYHAERVLGRGGMGTVFAAIRVADGRRVAIKTLHTSLATRDDYAERMLREAQAASAIPSEHVTQVLDVGWTADGRPFVVMELLEGQGLDDLLRKHNPLPVALVVDLVLQACVGLGAAHAAGVVHRDLKPSNLFLTERAGKSPIVKVLDFGIAKMLDTAAAGDLPTLTITGVTLGSPQYMSPEQLRSSRAVDGRSDIFSVAILLHKLLANKLPFDGETVAAYVAMIAADPPTPVRAHRPDVPEGLEAVMLKCLEKQPANRYQDVAALAAALAPFASPEGRSAVDDVAAVLADPSPTLIERRSSSEPPTLHYSGSGSVRTSGSVPLAIASSQTPPRSRGPTTLIVVLVGAVLGLIAFISIPRGVEAPATPVVAAGKATEAPAPSETAAARVEPSSAPSSEASAAPVGSPTATASAAKTPAEAHGTKSARREPAAPAAAPPATPSVRPKKKALMEDSL